MFKTITIGFSIFVILISLLGVNSQESRNLLPMLLTVNDFLTFARIAIASLVLGYIMLPMLQRPAYQNLIRLFGVGLLATIIAGAIGTNLFIRFIDFFVLVQGFVVCAVIALEPTAAKQPKPAVVHRVGHEDSKRLLQYA